MQVECIFINYVFDSFILVLKFRKYDVVIFGMDIILECSKQVVFSNFYYVNFVLVIVKKDIYKIFIDLKGKCIGMENGIMY